MFQPADECYSKLPKPRNNLNVLQMKVVAHPYNRILTNRKGQTLIHAATMDRHSLYIVLSETQTAMTPFL